MPTNQALHFSRQQSEETDPRTTTMRQPTTKSNGSIGWWRPAKDIGGEKYPSSGVGLSRFHFLRRKKIYHWQQPTITTAFKKQEQAARSLHKPTSLTQSLPVSMLSEDLVIHVLGYLEEQDCHAVMQTSRHFYNLLGDPSSIGQYIWNCLMQQHFPYIATSSNGLHAQRLRQEGLPDMRTLLGLKVVFPPSNVGGLVRSLQTIDGGTADDTNPAAVHFTGTVGAGNRCFRSDRPFTCPLRHVGAATKNNKNTKGILSRLRRRKRGNPDGDDKGWQPFVLPFQTQQGDFCLAPRLVSYFEVALGESLDGGSVAARGSACVAVGLSTYRFAMHRKMPGWDAHSFGFHGDDGSKFHNEGVGAKYGQRFGVNDTVGCGIDYQAKKIFYTLNGRFLGYAHTLDRDQIQKDWYPTVGVDSHAVCQFNFGKKPFAFDLQGMIQTM